jgi:predicted CoA-substrate-specific enzyme activase
MSFSLGLDIGSVSVKVALIDSGGNPLHFDCERITSGPQDAVTTILSRLSNSYELDAISKAGVSGSGSAIIPQDLNWAEYSSSLSVASGLLNRYADVKTIIQIGGQSSYVVSLEDGLRKPWYVASNSLCAAGTGRFLEQQAYRIGIGLEDFARTALECDGNPPRIAARCSVFAKTDLIHLQQKGVPMADMLYSLCESIARMVASLKKGAIDEPVYFAGGVAANAAMVRALNEAVSARNGRQVTVTVPENYLFMESIGSALLAQESDKESRVIVLPREDVRQRYYEMPRLEEVQQKDE